jgi:hypothetical protein
MFRIGLAVLGCLLLACNGTDKEKSENKSTSSTDTGTVFDEKFRSTTLPYQLSDTILLNNRDTASLPPEQVRPLVPDSILRQVFGKATQIKFTPLVKAAEKAKNAYYLVQATAGNKKAALLLVFNESGNHEATMPFLVPDNDGSTSQTSSIDKSFVITKSTTQRTGNEVTGEGKEVVAYDTKEKKFSLIMTDLLNDNPAILINPLDTFAKTNRLAGDYWANKKNLVAVRDGRHANQILVYIHTENSKGDCKGELKGEFILTGASSAVYRQAGDPCVLGLRFTGNTVSIQEESGCGNHRGLDCPLTGSFTRKKEEKPKETTKKQKRPKRP